MQAQEHATRDSARRNEVAIVDDTFATADLGSHGGELIPVLMMGGRRTRTDKTRVCEPHRSGADGCQRAASAMMSAREGADGTGGCFRARVKVTGVPSTAGHDQPFGTVTRRACLQLEALRGTHRPPLVPRDCAYVETSEGKHFIWTESVKRFAAVEHQYINHLHALSLAQFPANRDECEMAPEPTPEGRSTPRMPAKNPAFWLVAFVPESARTAK
jgi:hypothetical protein